MENQFTLSEKLILLAIRPEKGGISAFSSPAMDLVLTGAVMLELAMAGHIRIADKRIEVIDRSAGSPAQTYLLDKMAGSPQPRKIQYWLNSLRISMKKIRAVVYQSLVEQRQIRLEERRFLFFRWQKPFLNPGNHASQVIDKVKRLINQPSQESEETFLLLLLEPAQLIRRIYPDRTMRKAARMKIRQFRDHNLSSQAVQQATDVSKAIHMVLAARRAAAASA